MILAVLAVFVVPVAFLSGGVAFNAWRSGETSLALKAAGVLAVAVMVFAAAPKASTIETGRDCYIDWDARSNPTVCY